MPRLKLTATNVPHLPAEAGKKATEYRDSLLPGLVLRVTPAGVRTFSVEFHIGSGAARRHMRVSLGRYDRIGLADARELGMAVLNRAERGEAPKGPTILTVGTLVDRCLEAIVLRPKTRHEWERLVKKDIKPELGALLATDLTRADVRAWQRKLAARTGWVSNRAFEVLRRAYSWARAEELIEHSPCDHLPKAFEEKSSERVLSQDELRALMGALEDRVSPTNVPLAGAHGDAIWLLLYTGVRENAVVSARRDELEDLDGKEPRWIVPPEGAKRMRGESRPHVVPLSKQALAVVKRRLEATSSSAYLFPCAAPRKRAGDVPMVWSSVYIRTLKDETEARLRVDLRQASAVVPRWSVHNLRTSLGTHMCEDLGVDRNVVSLILGHTTSEARVTRVYNRAENLPQRRAALVAWGAWLERLKDEHGGKVLAFQSGPARGQSGGKKGHRGASRR